MHLLSPVLPHILCRPVQRTPAEYLIYIACKIQVIPLAQLCELVVNYLLLFVDRFLEIVLQGHLPAVITGQVVDPGADEPDRPLLYLAEQAFIKQTNPAVADDGMPIGTYDEETIRHWLHTFCRRFFTQQFKRSCLPDGPKVGSVSLSPRGDWRMSSDASSADWLSDLE